MPQFTVALPKGSRLETLQDFLKKRYKGSYVSVSRDDPPESRSDRLAIAVSDMENAKTEVESLKDELQNWHDNLPENLQSGSKADELDESISALEEVEQELDSAISSAEGVSFPGMF